MNDMIGSNDNLVETVFPKINEKKNLVNLTGDRDLEVDNTSKREEEKTKCENGKNVAVNLTAKTNRSFFDQKSCLDKNSTLIYSLIFSYVS